MKTARYGVESISIWCPECFEFQDDPKHGTQQFTEQDVKELPAVMECGYCGAKFHKPIYPMQRRAKQNESTL